MLKFSQSNEITSKIYQDALQIRTEVFVHEQNVSPLDEIADEKGPLYFVGYYEGRPVVTARVRLQGPRTWHIQRVAVKKEFRGQHIGQLLMQYISQTAGEYHIDLLTLGAQDQAQKFYLKLGFKVVGAGFLDAGIKHHRMDKALND